MSRGSYEMNNRLTRGGSLFGADPQTQLLTALRTNDYTAFKKLVESVDHELLEYVYPYPDYKSCLEIAVSEPGKEKFAILLLEHKVHVNKLNETHCAAPIHFAVENGNLEALKALLELDDTDINIKSKGHNTPLLLAIKKIEDLEDDREQDLAIYEDIIELLLKKGCNANTPDSKGVSPVYSASNQGLEKIVKLILDYSKTKGPVDIDTYKDRRGRNARHFLKEAFPHILAEFDSTEVVNDTIDSEKLFTYLYRHEEDNFISDFTRLDKDEREAALVAHNGSNTMLQLATEKGFIRVVDVLLSKGADPNATCSGNSNRPIEIACRNGYPDILRAYIAENSSLDTFNGDSLLQITINGMKSFDSKDPDINHKECLKILLKTKKINVNHRDIKKNTALHYAARIGDDDTVLELLRKGACIGLRNQYDIPPLADINAKTLETYLDECITTNGERPSDDDFEINIEYSFLVYPNNSYENELSKEQLMDNTNNNINKEYDSILAPETDALLYMTTNEELRQLLKHPVITSFLYLKWQRISCLFYANITFYSLLWLCLILYITLGYGVDMKQSDGIEALNVITRIGSIIGLIFLIIRETFQLLVSPIRYLQSIENWIEIALIIVTAWIVFYDSAEEHTKQQLSAIAILLSSAELVLLIGQFPTLSTNIVMLKTVSWNFFKFLLWYCILIIAFALSFYTLFREVVKEDEVAPNLNLTDKQAEEEEEDFFENPGRALFKTIVMLTGEFDAGSIKFSTFPITSHIIFMVFVFMVPIVLFNLLNGLAVSDTQEIRADAELVGHISRVKMISYFESILIGNVNNNHSKTMQCFHWPMKCVQPLAKRICLFPYFLPKYGIIVKPNNDNKIDIPHGKTKDEDDYDGIEAGRCCFERCQNYKLDRRIVKHAKHVIIKKNNVSDFDDIKDRIQRIDNTLNMLCKHIANGGNIIRTPAKQTH